MPLLIMMSALQRCRCEWPQLGDVAIAPAQWLINIGMCSLHCMIVNHTLTIAPAGMYTSAWPKLSHHVQPGLCEVAHFAIDGICSRLHACLQHARIVACRCCRLLDQQV